MATRWKGRKLALLLSVIVAAILTVALWQTWPRIRFRWQFEPLGKNARAYPEYRHRKTGIVFVQLPGGTFWMGAQKKDPEGQNYDPEAKKDEGPVHEVHLSPFLIAKYEVSQAEWEKVMGNNPSHFKGDHLPAETVSWNDCQEFCRKMGWKLPSEAEWEYACRAGASGPYAGALDELAWYSVNSGGKTHSVGRKKPNAFGLHDMHGNVWEWCEDIHDEDFYSGPEASGTDPICASGSGIRVFRGGCWGDRAWNCRSAYRYMLHPGERFRILGFRPCRPLP